MPTKKGLEKASFAPIPAWTIDLSAPGFSSVSPGFFGSSTDAPAPVDLSMLSSDWEAAVVEVPRKYPDAPDPDDLDEDDMTSVEAIALILEIAKENSPYSIPDIISICNGFLGIDEAVEGGER